MVPLSSGRVLVLSPHSDDGELGAGGTISRLIEEESEVYYTSFYTSPILMRECKNSVYSLGIPTENIINFDYEVRKFPENRQKILDDLLRLKDEIRPELVVCPSSYDIHQDHQVVYVETLRAFKTSCSIWGYEHPWNNCLFTTDIFVRLEEHHIEKKIEALKKYTSQAYRQYMAPQYILGLACVRGTQIGHRLAEAFETLRIVL